jgi:tetratricopeptide (TPR) repeat protein
MTSLTRFLLILGILLLAGQGLSPLREHFLKKGNPLVFPVGEQGVALSEAHPLPEYSPMGVLAFLGGFRPLLADLLWIQTYLAWEKKEMAAVWQHLQWTLQLDPENVFFWIEGARIVAYDFPRWAVDGSPNGARFKDYESDAAQRHYARQALGLLRMAAALHPGQPAFPLEAALLQWHRLGNLEAAAELTKRAATLPGAPLFAARAHGALLLQLGRNEEAQSWFRSLLQVLPKAYAVEKSEIQQLLDDLENN